MKKNLILVLALLLIFTGCDFVRTLAGRPTSAQVEQIHKDRMAREEALHQARLDSMKRVQQQMADSLAALEAYLLDSLSQAKGTILNPAKLGGLYATKLEARYCIIALWWALSACVPTRRENSKPATKQATRLP